LAVRVTSASWCVRPKPPEALRISRDLMLGNREQLLARMREESDVFQERLKSDEARAAFVAFMSRKKG